MTNACSQDNLALNSIRFLTTVAKSVHFALFRNEDALKQVGPCCPDAIDLPGGCTYPTLRITCNRSHNLRRTPSFQIAEVHLNS